MKLPLLHALGFFALLCTPVAADEPKTPSLDKFRDGAKHYRDGSNKDAYRRHGAGATISIADNILLYQRANGGWPSNWDPQRVLSDGERKQIAADAGKDDTTFDNRATYPQIEYLAEAFNNSGVRRYRDAAIRGLEFMLQAQHPCGGFPHSYPSKANYRPFITFMDDVTAGALGTLRAAAQGAAPFTFLDEALRTRLLEASNRGVTCLLRLQQPWEGIPAIWAGQYDPATLAPTNARPFELPGLVSAESVGVVRHLMDIEPPTPEISRAIEGAVRWFEAAKITGKRLEVFEIAPVRFNNHTATRDVRLVDDPSAPPLWARFYDLDSTRPFMANRDGIKVFRLEDVQIERRTGYSWYGSAPGALLSKEFPAWRVRWQKSTPTP